MKKLLCIMLTGIMIMSLSACSSTNDSSEDGIASVKESTESAQKEESESVNGGAESTDSAEGSVESASSKETTPENFVSLENGSPVYIMSKKGYYETADDDNMTLLYKGYDDELLLTDESKKKFPQLNDKLVEIFNLRREEADRAAKEGKENAATDLESGYLMGNYSDTRDVCLQRADSKVLSYYLNYYTYTNGAHGSYGISPYTIEVETGKELGLEDILKIDKDEFAGIVKDKILESAKSDEVTEFTDLDDTLSRYRYSITEEEANSTDYDNAVYPYTWYLANDGLHVYFEIYSIASYAYGDTDIVIGYDEKPEIFNSDYIPKQGLGFVSYLGNLYDKKIDIDNDGKLEKISMTFEYDGDDYSVYKSFGLDVDGVKAEFKDGDIYAEDNNFRYYHVRTADNRNYIYAMIDDMNDYYRVYVFDLNNDTVKTVKNGEESCLWFNKSYVHNSIADEYGEICPTDPNSMYFAKVFNLLGTTIAVGKYNVGSDGRPELQNDIFMVTSDLGNNIKLKESMEFDIVDESGNIVSQKETISSGSSVKPLYIRIIDGKNVLDCKLDDGRIARINFTSENYPIEIDGKSVEDLFEDLVFAG